MNTANDKRVMPSAWLLVWTIYMVKMVMIFAIFWSAHSFEPTVLVAASPAAFKMRLYKMKRRRAQLLRAEWMIAEDEPVPVNR